MTNTLPQKKRPSSKKKRPFGGLAARKLKGPLWKFTESEDGSFTLPDPDYINGLYFPLFNMAGMKCSVTPELKGDVCTSFNNFLTIPQVTEDFHLSKASRNFWVTVPGKEPWSATGVSAATTAARWTATVQAVVEAGIGWFSTKRYNKKLGLAACVTVFVPATPDTIEVMLVEIENTGKMPVRIVCTPASPIFGRSGDNLRDHRQVTSMFNEVNLHPYGVIVKPRIQHDEHGHRPNSACYGVFACSATGAAPKEIWSNMKAFMGEGGTLDNPESVAKGLPAPQQGAFVKDGVEAVCAARFPAVTLGAGKKQAYVIIRAISNEPKDFDTWISRYGSAEKASAELAKTRDFWKNLIDEASFSTDDRDFNNLMRWIAFQPFCRKIYGNSYLPDHDYGRGGRGWRDLWSDLLSLFLFDPTRTRDDIINNLHGIRIDGSNATIIGHKPGEFKADRNNIVRSWCDHGAWPVYILHFFMHHTADFDILLKEITYWKDHLVNRCRMRDENWDESQGNKQLDAAGAVYKGSILEHLLLQQLSAFYNVGEHNNLLLEGGDWNDTYDMARNRGESVCFYNWYGWNLRTIADWLDTLEKRGAREIALLSEIAVLLDRLPGQLSVNYDSPREKQQRLRHYCETIQHRVTGKKIAVRCADLAADLRKKADHIYNHIRRHEYLSTADGEHFYNGHYDDKGVRIHGDHPNGVRMDLTSQVLPILFDVASDTQVPQIHQAVLRYLRNPTCGGLRLCSDLGEIKLDFGRVSGFVYGFRENGSVWSQMNAMYLLALYSRGKVREGYAVLNELLGLCMNSAVSRILPNLPSTFHVSGKGMSCYLTGAATWLIVAMVSQVFGVRGTFGDLLLNPKLVKEQFCSSGKASIRCNFRGKKLRVTYINAKKLDWGSYAITAVNLNGQPLAKKPGDCVTIEYSILNRLCDRDVNEIEVVLG